MVEERFCRVGLLLGSENAELLTQKHVVVCGLGAVGSYALEALARLGVGRFSLIDFDEVRLSNINRQLLALQSTVGQTKAELAKARALDINPSCNVQAYSTFIDPITVPQLKELNPDLVIDAIDSLSSKVELLAYCKTEGIPIITSMGAALRRNPKQIKYGTIEEASKCPLARHVRKRLRRRNVTLSIPCVYSDEPLPPRDSIAPPNTVSEGDHLLSRGRERNVLGSISTLTGMFGLMLGHLALEMLVFGYNNPPCLNSGDLKNLVGNSNDK